MNYRLIPRFFYTLPFLQYLKHLVHPAINITSNNFITDAYLGNRLYFFNYARSGLRLLLTSLSAKKLNIGVQAYTCHTVFEAINKAGHELVFIDISENFVINLDDLQQKSEKIDVLILTHTFGIPANFNAVREIMGGKIIIEDCAHSFLSKYNDKYTGTLADAAIFSFGFGKFPPIGQGGFVIINNPQKFSNFNSFYNKLSSETLLSEIKHLIKKLLYSIMMRKPIYGLFTYSLGKKLNARFDFLKKNNLTVNRGFKLDRSILLKNVDLFEKYLKSNLNRYKCFKSMLHFKKIAIDYCKITPNQYIIPILSNNRDEIFKELFLNGIEPGKHFSESIDWALRYGYQSNDCPVTEKIIQTILTLSLHPGISNSTIRMIVEILKRYQGITIQDYE